MRSEPDFTGFPPVSPPVSTSVRSKPGSVGMCANTREQSTSEPGTHLRIWGPGKTRDGAIRTVSVWIRTNI
ncbi:MAG: hypothetical protein B5766_12075 [Candidatus Lumbricidophila eiseniae]|uniref:Uncharacterized protein n=1 Tax=Candidatus Lumbricidiphila eiseniae TaxID=1969409 RepID=A0A2A6FNA7_9MICO|nr:MAG: hypothetical protein B5766_12075 [Candidatus Lumbricidophila eiseniae]